MRAFTGWVTACVPHYGCHRYVGRAVGSLLAQSYPWVRVIVINDGDPRPPWPELDGINDPRLVRFELPTNRGPYFGMEIASRVTPDPYFLVQDADDWSDGRRVERLLDALKRDGSDFAVSAQPQVVETADGNRIVATRWDHAVRDPDAAAFVVNHALTPAYRYRSPHHGLFRNAALRAIGGYFGGIRINYDTLVPNLILMIGRISHVPAELYYRVIRPESLTHSPGTGVASAAAHRELRANREVYDACFDHYRRHRAGRGTPAELAAAIRQICGERVTPEQGHALDHEAGRLLALLQQRPALGR